uniref:Cilia- and flagella-associated protein 206 n=2 Tax=Mucochytrium quahogii TaxID=96639 RepID=A0A7S2R765_9STRA|mmetsp:Transcript_38161/g.61930  ORF Transcript_38161/g.61930 Transcript_38161/m.61930 type:complete len:1081 (+) Transcript_38161:1410-4652(+)
MYTCPVTTSPGRAQFSVLFQGHVYFCSSKASMDQFILSPQEYAGGPKETPGRTLFVVDEAIPKKTANGFCDRICEVLGWVAVNGYSPSATLGQQLTKNKSKWLLKVRSTQVPEELRRIFERGNMMPNRIVVVHEASQESEENGGKRYSRPAWTKFANELGLPFIDVPFQESSMLEILNFGNAFSGYDVQNDHLESITSMPEEDKKVALEGQLGMSGKYCPVTLQREKMLIPGKPTITACYQNATYCFIDEDARLEFQISPQTFVSQSIAGDAKPKPIIMVLGLPGSGKTMVAEHLKQKVGKGIDIINAQQLEESILAKRALLEESKATPDSQQEETESKDESKEGNEGEDNETTDGQEGPRDEDLGPKSITEEEWLEMITERIKNSKEHGTIIDGDVLSTQENAVQLLVNNNLHPTVVVDLRIEESLAVSRTLEKTFQWEPPEPEPVPVPEATEDGEEPAPPVEQPPPPTKEELTEMEQAAKDAATADISSIVQARAEILTAAFGTLKEAGINICKSVNMNGDTGKMHALRIIAANVQPYTSTVGVNGSISLDSHRAVVVDGNIALEMLKAGFIRQIPFADYCPVTWASQNYRLERAPARMKTNPVVYEGKLYHFLNETNLNMFLANPSRYALKGDFDLGVRAKCRCAVLGEPLSGKSTLAKGLRDSLGLVVVTPRGAVEYVLDQANLFDPHSGVELMFGKEVQMKVPPGELSSLAFDPVASLGIELVVKCIQARCTAHDAILNGYVLDGFPTTEHEAALLKEDSILDTAFILSDIPHSEKLKRSLEPIADVNRISKGQWIDLELAIKSQVPKCFYLNACNSPWSLVKSASCVLNESLVKVNRLFCNNEVEAQLTTSSPLCKSLSPMELVADKSMLVPTSGVTFCPVTFVENGSLERITPGNVVHLNGELYGFASQHQMIKFVGSPEAYVSALEDLKTRVDNLPPSPESVLEVGDREGYLKQTVSPLLCRALEELGIRRLKHPGLSVSETCSKFVALYLRANNSNVHQVCKKKREQTLAMFLEECELHDKINNMAATGTGIRAVRKKKETREEEDAVERYNKLLCQPISILTARLDIQHR